MVERHPDNVTAALVGGFVGSYLKELSAEEKTQASIPLAEVLPEYPDDAGPEWGLNPPIPPRGIGHYVRFNWAKEVKAIAIVPRFELSTAKARGVLPESYSRADLVGRPPSLRHLLSLADNTLSLKVFNLQRLAVLTTALGQSPPDADLIYEAMKDRVHQPYRNVLVCASSLLCLSLSPLTATPTSSDPRPPDRPLLAHPNIPPGPPRNLPLRGGADGPRARDGQLSEDWRLDPGHVQGRGRRRRLVRPRGLRR